MLILTLINTGCNLDIDAVTIEQWKDVSALKSAFNEYEINRMKAKQ